MCVHRQFNYFECCLKLCFYAELVTYLESRIWALGALMMQRRHRSIQDVFEQTRLPNFPSMTLRRQPIYYSVWRLWKYTRNLFWHFRLILFLFYSHLTLNSSRLLHERINDAISSIVWGIVRKCKFSVERSLLKDNTNLSFCQKL